MSPVRLSLIPIVGSLFSGDPLAAEDSSPAAASSQWETVECIDKPHARHEAAFIAVGDNSYRLGERRIQAVDIFDPATKTRTSSAKPPVEVHHFQPVLIDGEIWRVGAMIGNHPKEQAIDHIPINDPAADSGSRAPSLPEGPRRGGAGAIVSDDEIYVVCGMINGRWDANVCWLDVCDLATGKWTSLAGAPQETAPYQAVVIDEKIYAADGWRTNGASHRVFDLVVPEVDEYDIATSTWKTTGDPIPTPRAGTASVAINGALIVGGDESMAQKMRIAKSSVSIRKPGSGTSCRPLSAAVSDPG